MSFYTIQGALLLFLVLDGKYIGNSQMLFLSKLDPIMK